MKINKDLLRTVCHDTQTFLEQTTSIFLVLEEIESREKKKLSQEFSKTKSRVLFALSQLDKILLNAQIRVQSGTVPLTYRNMNGEKQEPTEDSSSIDPNSQAGGSIHRSSQSMDSRREETSYSFFVIQLFHEFF